MRHVLGALGVLLVISALSGSARAQNAALAEQLFNEARELAKANKWAEACPKFEASLRYDPVLGTRLNLATCYERVGKLASAWGIYRESIELAKKAGDGKRAEYAQKQAAALEPRLPKLVISAPPSAPAGLIVNRDGAPVAAAELGLALFVDPGAHEVTASAPGFETFTKSITLVEGKTETLEIPALVAKPVEPPKPGPEPEVKPIEPDVPPSPTRKYVGLGVGAAGVVAVGVGLVFGSKAKSTYGDAEALCGEDLVCTPENYAEAQRLYRDARSSATLSTALVIGGGVAIAAGAVVFITAPRAKERAASARLVPLIPERGAGLGVVGRF